MKNLKSENVLHPKLVELIESYLKTSYAKGAMWHMAYELSEVVCGYAHPSDYRDPEGDPDIDREMVSSIKDDVRSGHYAIDAGSLESMKRLYGEYLKLWESVPFDKFSSYVHNSDDFMDIMTDYLYNN